MNIKKISSTLFILIVLLVVACNKKGGTDNKNLSSGQSSLEFKTSTDFGGTNIFKSNSPLQSKIMKGQQGSKDNITIIAIQANGMKVSTGQLSLFVPTGATTSGALLTGKFDNGSNSSTKGVLVISTSNGGANQKSYASKTGNITITKLTATEIEGTFDGICENETTKENITLTNGIFAGKF